MCPAGGQPALALEQEALWTVPLEIRSLSGFYRLLTDGWGGSSLLGAPGPRLIPKGW